MGQTELNCLYQKDELIDNSANVKRYGCHFEHKNIDVISQNNKIRIFHNAVCIY